MDLNWLYRVPFISAIVKLAATAYGRSLPKDEAVRWSRDTPWRQGHVLKVESVKSLGFSQRHSEDETAVIVISHDCDLAQNAEEEPFVEVLVGRFLLKEDGNYTSAKNLRRLHLPCVRAGENIFVELHANVKSRIPKTSKAGSPTFVGHVPEESCQINASSRVILQSWLAARYRRSVFADEFDRRLRDETKLAEKLARILKTSNSHIHAIFFDVDEQTEVIRNGADDPYELTITLLYRTDVDPAISETAAVTAQKAIKEAFLAKCFDASTGKWQWIELCGVEVVSDEAMTYAASQKLSKWHSDYISFRSTPMEPTLSD